MEDAGVSFNFHDSSHGFAEKNAQITDEDDDFEFTHISSDHDVAADEIFGPVFPLFNRDLLTRNGPDRSDHGKKLTELLTLRLRLPLEKSFRFADESDHEERGPPSSPSSESEADDACRAWRPESVGSKSPHRYRKSDLAGTLAAKQWKLSDFLHRRSSSEGREGSFAFFAPENGGQREGETQGTVESTRKKAGKANAKKKVSAHEVYFCVRKLQGEKRKSFLPYRQYLVGFFANCSFLKRRRKPPFFTRLCKIS